MSYRKLAPHPLHSLLRTAAGTLGAVAPLMALANPSGGQVVAGSASIGSAGANGLVINQNSQNAVINWQQFSVGANQYVQFVQPNSSSVVLNRVIGNNASSIFGSIKANGQVFLVNPNGILFGRTATLDVGGLVASSLDISDRDFMSGHYVFSKDAGAPDAAVANQGYIHTADGGYVVLAGDYVRNYGQIDARLGTVYLAVGGSAALTLNGNQLISYVVDSATLSRLAGVTNTGEIVADGGMVVMTADVANALTATAVNNMGFITAHSVKEHGGVIVLEAEGGGIYNSNVLDASAVGDGVAGGAVIVHATGGDTELTANSQIDVMGQGGGKGGFVDVSGHDLTLKGFIEVGKGGNLLLDPSTITIESAGTTNPSNCSGCEGGVIHTNFIQHELNTGVNLTIVASNQIIIGSNSRGGPATNITATGGTGQLSLKIGSVNINSVSGSLHNITGGIYNNSSSLDHTFTPTTGGTISLAGLTINIKGGFVASASLGNVTLGNVTANGINISGKSITTKSLTANNLNVIVNAAGTASGSGSIHVVGNVSALNDQVLLHASNASVHVTGNVTAASNVTLSARGSANANHITVGGNITGNNVTVSASGNGNSGGDIAIGNATAKNFGVSIIATNNNSGATNFKVATGNLTAAKNVSIFAGGSSSAKGPLKGAKITAGAITAYTSSCAISDCNRGAVHIAAPRGSVKVSGGILVNTSKADPGSVSISAAKISFGNITAKGDPVHIGARTTSSTHSRGINQATGTTITARDIFVDFNASYGGVVTLANLTASSANGPALVGVQALSHNAGNSIVVNGNITVNGKGGNLGFSSAMPGAGVPFGAAVDLQASGSAAATHTITVKGNVTVTAQAGTFNIARPACSVSCGSVGPHPAEQASGVDALAEVRASASGSHGSVNLAGNVSATGPVANVNLSGDIIKVAGNLTVTGHGGTATLDTLVTGSGGYHTHFKGPGPVTGVTLGGVNSTASVNVGGTVSVTGPGLIGVAITGAKVTLGGLDVSASAAASYSVLDTRVSNTTDKFTLGSAAVLVFQGSNSAVTGPATITGGVTVDAPHGSVYIESQLKAGGPVSITAGRNITDDASVIGPRFGEISGVTGGSSGSPGVPSAAAVPLQITAAGVSMKAANGNLILSNATLNAGGVSLIAINGSIDMTSATVKSPGIAALDASGNIILSGVSINVGTFVAAAGGTIHNGGGSGSITAKALALHAGKDITLSSTALSVGSGSIPQDSVSKNGNAALALILLNNPQLASATAGDPQLQGGFAAGGIGPFPTAPNATFIAGGHLTLGNLTLTGNYLYLQGLSVSLLGPVTTPQGILVQVAPINPAGSTDFEGTGAAGANVNLNNTGFLDLFQDGATLVLGASGQTGSVSLGNTGSIDIGSDNLIVDTSGTITGLSNIISTGLVSSLEGLLGSVVVPPTPSEIDPNSSNNNNAAGDKKHQGVFDPTGGSGPPAGSITQDTGSGVCH